MKKIYILITFLSVVACGNRQTDVAIQYDALASYEDIDKAIEHLVGPGNWNADDCTTIDARINACEMYGLIDERQCEALKMKLNSYSNKYLYDGVDALFRKASYKGLDFWRDMLAYMEKQYDSFTRQNVSLASANMKKAKNIIDDYDKVCRWANASGHAKAEFLQKYPINISSAVAANHKKIEAESNYQTYFKGNTDLRNAMNGMQARMEKSRVRYYDELEKLVEKHITENELSEEDALDLQLRFNALESSSSTHSAAAIEKLADYVDDYIDTLIEEEDAQTSVCE